MNHLSIDIETYCEHDISAGAYRYASDPSFEILLYGFSFNGSPTYVLDMYALRELPPDKALGEGMLRALYDPGTIKHAANAAFEWFCISVYLGRFGYPVLPIEQWHDTALHAMYCGLPAKLEEQGRILGLDDEGKGKMSAGAALIRTFSIPCRPTKKNGFRTRNLPQHEPEQWELFKKYNARDVDVEMGIDKRLEQWPVPDDVIEQWHRDVMSNFRGVEIDVPLMRGAIAIGAKEKAELLEPAKAITGLENPNSTNELKDWLEATTGLSIPNVTKATVEDLIKTLPDGPAKEMLKIRQQLNKTSCAKYDAMAYALCADNRVRGMLMFYGANRTGRWAGRIVQLQNLPRTSLFALDDAREWTKRGQGEKLKFCYGDVQNALSQLIRTALIPKSGCVFIDADFSAIEARVVAWLAGEEWVLEVFRGHGKIYEATASQMFNVPLEKIKKGNPEYSLRQRGKVAVLALGYGGGVNALTNMDTGHALTDEEKPGLVKKWRKANPNIVKSWKIAENAAIETLRTGRPVEALGLVFRYEANEYIDYLTIELPSRRKLFYASPKLSPGKFGQDAIHYYGVNQKNGKWWQLDTWGGKLIENIVQAIARDCLAVNIERLENAGYKVVFHVHDEVVIEAPKREQNEDDLKDVCRIMGVPVWFAPELPLKAEGWIGEYYTKD